MRYVRGEVAGQVHTSESRFRTLVDVTPELPPRNPSERPLLTAQPSTPGTGVAIARYGAARAALVAVIAAVLTWVGVPLLVAILIGLVVALPLSLLLFSTLRKDLDNALAVSGARRREQKARLRAQLRGES